MSSKEKLASTTLGPPNQTVIKYDANTPQNYFRCLEKDVST